MAFNVQIQKLSEQIHEELSSPSGISQTFIADWLINNVGQVNNVLGTNYTGVEFSGVNPSISGCDLPMFGLLFEDYYLGRIIKQNIGASAYVTDIRDSDGSSIKVVSKTDIAKVAQTDRKAIRDQIKDFVNSYKINKGIVGQVATEGDWSPIVIE